MHNLCTQGQNCAKYAQEKKAWGRSLKLSSGRRVGRRIRFGQLLWGFEFDTRVKILKMRMKITRQSQEKLLWARGSGKPRAGPLFQELHAVFANPRVLQERTRICWNMMAVNVSGGLLRLPIAKHTGNKGAILRYYDRQLEA